MVTFSDVAAGAAATAARGVTVAVRCCCVAGAWTRIKSAKSLMSVSSSLSSKQSPKSGKKSGVSSLTKPDIVLAAAFANISDTVAAAAAEFFCALVVRLFGLFGLFLGGFD